MAVSKIKWTPETLQAEALKYETRVSFAKGNQSAYQTAHKHGVMDEICSHMERLLKPTGYWTIDRVREAASTYSSRREFEQNAHPAYKAAWKKGWLDDVCAHMQAKYRPPGYWTFQRCAEAAAKYNTVPAFIRGEPNAHRIAYRNGWLEDITEHVTRYRRRRGFWTDEQVHEEMLKHRTRADFKRAAPSAYTAARERNLLAQTTHFVWASTVPDTLYLWEAVGLQFNGNKVYKIGVTGSHLGKQRPLQTALKNGMEYRLVIMRWVGAGKAESLERHLLENFREDPKLDVKDGKTEFRALTPEQLKEVCDIINAHTLF